MTKPKFGVLKEVDIRELWKHEQYDFSAWLAEDDNIYYLNDILGLNLVDIKKEERLELTNVILLLVMNSRISR